MAFAAASAAASAFDPETPLIKGDWKIVNPARGKAWELYHLKTDATETTNLAAAHTERVAEMAAIYARWTQRVNQK